MIISRTVAIPDLVRIKPGALDRAGLYVRRGGLQRVAVYVSRGLPVVLVNRLLDGLASEQCQVHGPIEIEQGSFELAVRLFEQLPVEMEVVIGLGGGKALDVAKYVSFLARRPFFAIPASLSNDGFASPQSSLTVGGCRRSFPSGLPQGVIVDTEVCGQAPLILWLSGIGDLVAKLTAVADWKLAFHHSGTPINDFSALLSDATVMQFIARPTRDAEGLRIFATALLLNGVSMELAGCSRPASGSEHLISHALDEIAGRPKLHGQQVGMASYLVSRLQGEVHTERIGALFDQTGFWQSIREDPFITSEFLAAVERAPRIKRGFHTVLDEVDGVELIQDWISRDPSLKGCFVDNPCSAR